MHIHKKIYCIIFFSILFVSLIGFIVPDVNAYFTATRRTNTSMANCSNYGGDSDGDAICDNWEPATIGNPNVNMVITFPTGNPNYVYVCGPGTTDTICPRKDHKDIFVEVDYMEGHLPDSDAIQDVKNAFDTSPVTNPDGQTGIKLHVQVDEQMMIHSDSTPFPGSSSNPGFDQQKAYHFGTVTERGQSNWGTNGWKQKQQVFHYALFVHSQYTNPSSSGIAEVFGNDFMITLGSFTGGVGSRDEQAGAFMHELGHNLNLQHGGKSDNINCKPNYLSVMSYSREFSNFISNRPLDYSRSVLSQLVEISLSEPNGVSASTPSGLTTVYGPPAYLIRTTGQAFDWNRDGDLTDTGVSADINNLGTTTGCGASAGQTLNGYNDWSNLDYNFRNDSDAADGISSEVPPDEITKENVVAMLVAHVDSLEYDIKNIPDKALKNDINVRKYYSDSLSDVRNLVKSDSFSEALSILNQMSKTLDDHTGIKQSNDFVIDHLIQKKIFNELNDLEVSLHKASDYKPTSVHP